VALTTDARVPGYYTLAAASIAEIDLPDDVRKKLPRYLCLPAVLTGRLALDLEFRERGQGALCSPFSDRRLLLFLPLATVRPVVNR
jgi:hypothetical protein